MDTVKFKSLLLQRQRQLNGLSEDAAAGTETVELDQTRVGRLSRIDAMQQQQMNLESQRRRSRELLALDAALKRIEHGDYGLCQDCDEEINPNRLEIDPVAALCINCASRREQA
jgi:DnaK suppressor protein